MRACASVCVCVFEALLVRGYESLTQALRGSVSLSESRACRLRDSPSHTQVGTVRVTVAALQVSLCHFVSATARRARPGLRASESDWQSRSWSDSVSVRVTAGPKGIIKGIVNLRGTIKGTIKGII